MNLSFKDFYRLVTGFDPFLWQERFAEEALGGRWPNRVTLPTSAGKSSLVEIWAYCLAREAENFPVERRTPMRLVYIVDRRLVVDAVYERAKHLADLLLKADQDEGHPLYEFAKALRNYGAMAPLVAAVLRGGMVRETLWVDAPNQPAVLTATVDQAGSRLLFRGYGISHYQRPVQAGLLGCDSLFIVDEAHLSSAFVQTLEHVRRVQSSATVQVRPPLRVVAMSATLGSKAEPTDAFRLLPAERAELSDRLAKPKFCVFREAHSKSPFDLSMAKAALEMAERIERGVVGVIVNRVDTARNVFEQLRDKGETVLLTGRARPYERDQQLKNWKERLSPYRDRTEEGVRFVVATQTVEVGADFDFDGLVLEFAPLSAFRQRMGRLNRIGVRDHASAIVVRRKESDRVYDKKVLDELWKWFTARLPQAKRGQEKTLDLCDEALSRILEREDPPTEGPPVDAPWLSRPYVEQWSQTWPTPHPDPDITPFLHGKIKAVPEVQVVWRGDITQRLLENARSNDALLRNLNDQLALAPPSTYEAIALPVWTVRAWLSKWQVPGMSDLEGAGETDSEDQQQPSSGQLVLRHDGIRFTVVPSNAIRPGDTVVVPAEYGHVDEFGWNPNCEEPARDIGDLAGRTGRVRQRLRLHPLVLPSWFEKDDKELLKTWEKRLKETLEWLNPDKHPDVEEAEDGFKEELAAFVEGVLDTVRSDVREALEEWLRTKEHRWQAYPLREGEQTPSGIVLIWRSERIKDAAPAEDPVTEEEEESSFIGNGVTAARGHVSLGEHCREVSALAEQFASRIGLPTDVTATLAVAGFYHDIGKGDPRFQVMLFGGDEAAAAAADELIAKSGMDSHDRAVLRRARELAGFPRGKRHEELSVALLRTTSLPQDSAADRELLEHLIGTHHGRGRPWFPVVDEQEPVEISIIHGGIRFSGPSRTGLERLDSGWAEQFSRLQHRYGFWGLAFLEAVLRLADARVSDMEARKVV